MNPKTSLTRTQITKLCRLHGLVYRSSRRVKVGFSNEIHIINDELVLKFYLHELIRYQTELAMLETKTNFPKPKLIATGMVNNFIGHNYILMSLVEGVPLGHVWHKASMNQRHSLIESYIAAQKEINQLPPETLPLLISPNWYKILRREMAEVAKLLKKTGIISNRERDRALAIVDHHAELLKASPLKPVYRDIHLDNLMVNDNFELTGLIDFEFIQLAALDYPLFVLKRLVDEPKQYACEEFVKLSDYQPLWSWYKKLYPEMFAFTQLENRLRIYQLADHLRLLKRWSQVKSVRLTFKKLLRVSI